MKITNKSQVNVVNSKVTLGSVTRQAELRTNEGLYNWILCVRDSKLFTSLPSYFDVDEIPLGTLPSQESPLVCYKRVVAYFKTNVLEMHPNKVIEAKLMESPVKFTPVKVETAKNEILEVKKGYLIPENTPKAIGVVASAYVSTALPYHVKYDSQGRLIRVGKEEDYKKLGWKYPDGMYPFRAALGNDTRSAGMAQQEMYRMLRADFSLAIHMMSGILSLAPEFSVVETALQDFMTKKYEEQKVSVSSRYVPRVPIRIVLKTVKKARNLIDDAYKFLYKSRQLRGQDGAGIGTLTIGYYFFDMPRNLAKHISMVYDLRALMKHYNVRVVMLSSAFDEYVKRAMVENGYIVIVDDMSAPSYKDEPGMYSDIPASVSALQVKNVIISKLPDVAKGQVNYPDVNLDVLINTMLLSKGKGKKAIAGARYTVSKLPLLPILNDERFSLFPSSMPHNAFVWVSRSIVSGSYKFEDMLFRCIAANIYRNQFPLNRACYWTIDPMANFFQFGEGLALPRLTVGKRVREEDSFGFEENEVIPKFANQDVLTINVSDFESEGRTENQLVIVGHDSLIRYIREMLSSEDQIPIFLFEQYEKWLQKKPIYSYTRDLFNAYKDNMEDLFEKFGFTGFEDNFNDYTLDRDKDKGKKNVQVSTPVSAPVTVSTPDVLSVSVDGIDIDLDYD